MTPESAPQTHRSARRIVCLAALLALAVSSVAFGSAGTLRLNGSANAGLGKSVVVNPAGRTLYSLSAETPSHLLCKGACLHVWPPLTVPSRFTKVTLGSGVHGKVGVLHRSNGAFQVTLRGKPLYRFSGDHAKGEANGEGIEADGGTWHAAGAATTPAPVTPPTTPASPYEY